MAAGDHLNRQFDPHVPVYHGSPHGFAPGDTIDPTPDNTHMGGESAAFGVTNTSTAGYFGLQGAAEPRSGQGRLFSSVYEVAPKSRYELHPSTQAMLGDRMHDPHAMDLPENNMPIDRAGFEVKRHAAFAFPDQEGLKKGHLYEKLQPTPGGAG